MGPATRNQQLWILDMKCSVIFILFLFVFFVDRFFFTLSLLSVIFLFYFYCIRFGSIKFDCIASRCACMRVIYYIYVGWRKKIFDYLLVLSVKWRLLRLYRDKLLGFGFKFLRLMNMRDHEKISNQCHSQLVVYLPKKWRKNNKSSFGKLKTMASQVCCNFFLVNFLSCCSCRKINISGRCQTWKLP